MERSPSFLRQAFLHKPSDSPRMPCVRSAKVFADPSLNVCDIGPLISGDSFASRELREGDTEAHVVYILVDHEVLARTRQRRIFEKFQKRLAGIRPSFLVFVYKRCRIGECLGE